MRAEPFSSPLSEFSVSSHLQMVWFIVAHPMRV